MEDNSEKFFMPSKEVVGRFFQNNDFYFGKTNKVASTILSFISNEFDILYSDDNVQAENSFMFSNVAKLKRFIVKAIYAFTASTETCDNNLPQNNDEIWKRVDDLQSRDFACVKSPSIFLSYYKVREKFLQRSSKAYNE